MNFDFLYQQLTPELIADFNRSAQTVTDNAAQIDKLEGKVTALEASIPALNASVTAAGEVYSKALADHVADLADDVQVTAARKASRHAAETLTDATELLGAVKQALQQALGQVSILNNRKQAARARIFRRLSELALAELRERGQDLFYLLDASARISGADRAGHPFEGLHPSSGTQFIRQIEAELFNHFNQPTTEV